MFSIPRQQAEGSSYNKAQGEDLVVLMQLLVLLVQRRTQRSSSLCSADRIVIFSGCFVRCFPATKDLLPFPFLFVSMEAKTEIMQTILYVTVVVVAAGGILLGESASRGALSP